MNHRITALLASAAMTFVAGSAFAQTAAPAPAAAPAPPAPPTLATAMSASLAANGSPMSFDMGFLGEKVYVTGALTGIALTQNNVSPGTYFPGYQDYGNEADISNAQIMINKVDGLVQYFVQIGDYSFPSLGAPYEKSTDAVKTNFGIVPEAFIKIAPTGAFSIEGGKLPTLTGAEYNFTYQNLNIERGLLWGIEPAVSRGVQANYSQGAFSGSVSFNDGLYSNQYNTVSGLLTWTITPSDILAVAGTGTTKKTTFSYYNNQTLINVLYTHTMGPWTINPYFQYSDVPAYKPGGFSHGTITSGALLLNYAFDSKSMFSGIMLPLRGEYVSGTGALKGTQYSVTFTPTYQYKIYFIRGEVSYTGGDIALFGPKGTDKTQTRGVIETGVLF